MSKVSLLDCIKRVPERVHWILENREKVFEPLETVFGEKARTWDELVFVGCGTSNTAAVTARFIAQKLAGIRVTPALPDDFIHEAVIRNPKALYVFVSQTGTSVLTRDALKVAKANGYDTLALSESADTPISRETDAFMYMGCGVEEYPMRTIGYSTSVLSLILLGFWVGRKQGHLTDAEQDAFLADTLKAADQIVPTVDRTLEWLEKERRQMMRSDCLVFTGSGTLCGLAMEAAVKMWETPQIVTLSFELEEGLHSANYGYTSRHCVIALNDGGYDNDKARALIAYMKNEKQNGFVIGAGTLDEHDFAFDCSSSMNWLVFAAVVQTMSYHLAVAQGRDLFAPHDNHVMYSYFDTHNELGTRKDLK